MNTLNKLLLSELRIIEGENISKDKISKEGLKLALVDKENLNALGYDLKVNHFANLAADYSKNKKFYPLFERVQEFEPEIKVSPMYPNFPLQVQEMSEEEFRSNQILHYFSTYGLEYMFDIEVKEGLLPKTRKLMERVEDEQVIPLKTIDYLTPSEVNEVVINKLAGKKERLLPNELAIVKFIVKRSERPLISEVPFKENIGSIFGESLLNGNLQERYRALNEVENIIKHPGDVLDLTEQLVKLNKYKHFKTSLKRGIVEMLEKFPVAALEENLASNRWSNSFLGAKGKARSRNRNIQLIDYLSYNKFSKKPECAAIVNQLKNGELYSWNQKLEKAYYEDKIDVVMELLRQRPGMYFRQLNRLQNVGMDLSLLSEDMFKMGKDLKTQSIISAMNNFDGDKNVVTAFYHALLGNLKAKEIEKIHGKKVYLESNEIDFEKSVINVTDKFEEGGYIQNGMAIKLPEDAKILRFFTYWNDKKRIDIDLHATYLKNGYLNHVGWHGDYKSNGVTYSGDITHSNAAEYVDMDIETALKNGIEKLQFNINSYSRVPFKDIDTVFCGVMVVGELKEKVKLYSAKNTLFRHDLMMNNLSVEYAYIDLKTRTIQIVGKSSSSNELNDTNIREDKVANLSMQNYLTSLFSFQDVQLVDKEEDAEVVIGLAKSDKDNYLSLIDENFFMDY